MSFFKKLKAELKEMLNDKDKEDQIGGGKCDSFSQNACPKADDLCDPAQAQDQSKDVHNQPAPNPYGQPLQHQHYHQHGNAPPPPGNQLRPGWVSQWDQNSQRYYFFEQPTGRTQWELPVWEGGPPFPQGGPGYYQTYGHTMPSGVPYQQGHDEHQRAYYGGAQSQEKKDSGMRKVGAAGISGAAVGALTANALYDSDDARVTTGAPYGNGAPPPSAPPVALEGNPEVSSSQRESLEETREDLEEAQEKVAEEGSDASSSDLEDLQEAREEYHSEVEDAEGELED